MFICLTCKTDEACLNFMALKEDADFRVPCPEEGCTGELLQLDDNIAEAVVLLNDKGYTTRDSCGGHFNNGEGLMTFYVAFEEGRCPDVEPPDGFWLVPGEAAGFDGMAVFFLPSYSGAPDQEFAAMCAFQEGNRTLQVLEASKRFLDWVLALPASQAPQREQTT